MTGMAFRYIIEEDDSAEKDPLTRDRCKRSKQRRSWPEGFSFALRGISGPLWFKLNQASIYLHKLNTSKSMGRRLLHVGIDGKPGQ
jgi:hypothetical protein